MVSQSDQELPRVSQGDPGQMRERTVKCEQTTIIINQLTATTNLSSLSTQKPAEKPFMDGHCRCCSLSMG